MATPSGRQARSVAARAPLPLRSRAAARGRRASPRTGAGPGPSPACHRTPFAIEAGCAALEWLSQGFGYEITGADVWMAYASAMNAAEALGRGPETKERIRKLASSRPSFVTQVLGPELKDEL